MIALFYILLTISFCQAQTVYDEIEKRAQTSKKELLAFLLKRQYTFRKLNKLTNVNLSFSSVLEGLIKRNAADSNYRNLNDDATFNKLLEDKTLEVESKRIELLQRLMDHEVDKDITKLSDLIRQLVATSIDGKAEIKKIRREFVRKWKEQKKALTLLQRARDSKHSAIVLCKQNKEKRTRNNRKMIRFHIMSCKRYNSVALRCVKKAMKYEYISNALMEEQIRNLGKDSVTRAREFLNNN